MLPKRRNGFFMRVITGSARGRRLMTLEGDAVRPTAERVKEALFSAIQFDIEGRRALDLFAGSGQLGIEALSRSALSCTFVDSAQASLDVVRQNLAHTGFSERGVLHRGDALAFLRSGAQQYDLVFLDPPYAQGLLADALLLLPPRLSAGAAVICESPAKESLPTAIDGLSLTRSYHHGKTSVHLYHADSD